MSSLNRIARITGMISVLERRLLDVRGTSHLARGREHDGWAKELGNRVAVGRGHLRKYGMVTRSEKRNYEVEFLWTLGHAHLFKKVWHHHKKRTKEVRNRVPTVGSGHFRECGMSTRRRA